MHFITAKKYTIAIITVAFTTGGIWLTAIENTYLTCTSCLFQDEILLFGLIKFSTWLFDTMER